MRVARVALTESVEVGGTVALPRAEARHVARVLRRVPGDPLEVLLPDGGAWLATIVAVAGDDAVTVRIERAADPVPEVRLELTVAVALVKGPALEAVVRMGTEVGIARIRWLETARTIVRWRDPVKKLARCERLAREAGKQCGRRFPVAIDGPIPMVDFLRTDFLRTDFLPTGEGGKGPDRWILAPGAPRVAAAEVPSAALTVAIGPEGGFTPEELALAATSGWRRVGLATPVLRTPTAVAAVGGWLLAAP